MPGIDMRRAGEEGPAVLGTGEVVDNGSVTGTAGLGRLPMAIVVREHIRILVHNHSEAAAPDSATSRLAMRPPLQAGLVKETVPVH